jgi:BMFP domain-containing protein YqiC
MLLAQATPWPARATGRCRQGRPDVKQPPIQALNVAHARPIVLQTEDLTMTQTSNRLLDEFARLMTDAAGAAQGVKREVEGVMRAQGERMLKDMDVVRREEFEVVKAMAEKARAENERLEARIAALEAELARIGGRANAAI